MEIKVDVKITQKEMYNFLLYHNYTAVSGIVATLLGVGLVISGLFSYGSLPATQSILLVVFGLYFTVFQPLNLMMKAKQQIALSPVFKEKLSYTFQEKEIKVTQKGEESMITWEDIRKVASTKVSLIVYFAKAKAFILPKENIGDQYEALIQMIEKKVPAGRCKIRDEKGTKGI